MNLSDALYLYKEAPLVELMAMAHDLRQAKSTLPYPLVSWQIDRNINTTNVCVGACRFCTFHCRLIERGKAYVTSMEEYHEKIEQTIACGGDQILLQGGMSPELGLNYYTDLFKKLRIEFPSIKLHALGPAELIFLSRKAGISVEDTLDKLLDAGMSSLPGAGAEILDNEWRAQNSPGKCSADEWISVMKIAHKRGILTSATMMYGFRDSDYLRIKHLMAIRELQAETGGFLAFIPWPYRGAESKGNDTTEYLRMVAIARIVLDNVPNIQASWLTVGEKAAMMALHGGANDLGSIMIEENVVRSAGCLTQLRGREWMISTITKAGFTPALRNQAYELR